MILPCGPLPLTLPRGIPRSNAIFFAIGDAKIRSPAGRSTFESDSFGGGDFGSGEVDGDVFGSGDGLSDFFDVSDAAETAFWANSAADERSSPSSATMAMGEPTWTFFEPSWA